MLKIDPHTHSNHSDGTDTPAQLMRRAADAGLDMVGLTDHDVTTGHREAAGEVRAAGVALLRGMEMSCAWQGITVHLLSYLHDPQDPALVEASQKVLQSRRDRAKIMVEKISQDYPITWDDVVEGTGGDVRVVGRPHIADALIRAGSFSTRDEAFAQVLHPRGPYYQFLWAEDPVVAVQKVRAAGGVPIIAHPRARARQKVLPMEAIYNMVEAGLAGLEVRHRDNPAEDQEFLLQVARERDLLVTGSSDYHGTGKPNRLGENTTPVEVIQEIESQGRLSILWP
ncbi:MULTISPECIES: PHP domain-containing protein [unclassified Actinomyces]|uniref:PHP domain-containing protein n=1 Tax=unclassified Actinomyces TaxID=2609248 RepID=UPI0008A4DFB9|nr:MULTISPECIES: PHP domain-containing protein [unclassified Actinomyces]MDK8532990.1 PHP domain-containing protein [Gleimia europaea]MBS5825804.1 PHP domain-containing protein [Actinomyces sp.]MDU4831642.1 PHP domain-containing protein [Actinomyces sp.]MDU5230836.1 PHP domain-containing protein [Actinomyces sp.]MDU5568375.1 PHP domain-containing protein [Actinomyces sp.]